MKNYLPKSTKTLPTQIIINEALDILECVGIPLNTMSERRLEKMAVCFLAVAGVINDWKTATTQNYLKTRDIIKFVNLNFEENISSGSYDDIRRKDLKLLIIADFVINSGDDQSSATNNPTRGYSIHPDFERLLIHYSTDSWEKELLIFNQNRSILSDILSRKREINKIPVTLPGGKPIELSVGEHNQLQKQVIEHFLPRFGADCEVLYIGDSSNKILFIDEYELSRIGFFELSHDELPDIIAFSRSRNWLYLVEAVHSSGPMSEIRVLELKKLLKNCKAELIFVTAFLTKTEFRKWLIDIAWETEVWTADNPDHLVHFNGHKFLGAY
jgi:type II restriction enzyme